MGSRKSANKLTKKDLDLAACPEYPLRKQKIFRHIQELMAQTGNHLQNQDDNFIKKIWPKPYFKISKGENLDAMPYMVLDFPRISGQEFPVLLRVLFWWGRHISISLVIRTELIDREATAGKLANRPKLRLLCSDELWNHDLESGSYSKVKRLDLTSILNILTDKDHVKIGRKYPVRKIARVQKLSDDFLSLMEEVIVMAEKKPDESGS